MRLQTIDTRQPLTVLTRQARLKLEWRRFLTQQLLSAYFSRRAFFNLKLQAVGIDNPDQVRRDYQHNLEEMPCV